MPVLSVNQGNNLYMPLRGIQPGEVGVINLTGPGGMQLSTGIMVVYADEVSFSFMTPEGPMFAGRITFSAFESALHLPLRMARRIFRGGGMKAEG